MTPPPAAGDAAEVSRRRPTIAEMLARADRPLFSFEFMPPRSEDEMDVLWRAIEELVPLGPDFVSVTYGANGSKRDRTIRTTRSIMERTQLQTMGHLTVVDQPTSQLRETIADYAAAGVTHILALRGDPPGGADTDFTGVNVTSYPAHAVDGSRDNFATTEDNSNGPGVRPNRWTNCSRAMSLRNSARTPTGTSVPG